LKPHLIHESKIHGILPRRIWSTAAPNSILSMRSPSQPIHAEIREKTVRMRSIAMFFGIPATASGAFFRSKYPRDSPAELNRRTRRCRLSSSRISPLEFTRACRGYAALISIPGFMLPFWAIAYRRSLLFPVSDTTRSCRPLETLRPFPPTGNKSGSREV
jgi:hypothetical protein